MIKKLLGILMSLILTLSWCVVPSFAVNVSLDSDNKVTIPMTSENVGGKTDKQNSTLFHRFNGTHDFNVTVNGISGNFELEMSIVLKEKDVDFAYTVYVNDSPQPRVTHNVDLNTKTTISLGTISLTGNNDVIRFVPDTYSSGDTGKYAPVFLYDLTLTKLPELDIDKYYANGTLVLGNEVIYGSDVLKLEMTNELVNYDETTVELSGENGVCSTDFNLNGKNIEVYLKETLKKDASYTLTVTNVKDTYGQILAEDSITFTTEDGELEAEAFEINKENIPAAAVNFNLSGSVKSSVGYGMNSRNIYLSAENERTGDVFEKCFSGVSGADGNWSIDFSFDENWDSDRYTITAHGDFTKTSDSVSVLFVSTVEKGNMVQALQETVTEDDVEDFFDSYKEKSGISLDIYNAINDKSGLYNKLIGYTADDFDDLYDKLMVEIVLECINQQNSETTDIVISDMAVCEMLGLEKNMKAALGEDWQSFCEALTKSYNSVNEITEEYKNVASECLVTINGKECIIALSSESQLSYDAASCEISFTEAQTNVKKIKLTFSSEDNLFKENIKFESTYPCSVISENESEIVAEITVPGNNSVEKIGKLSFATEESYCGSMQISAEAEVTYTEENYDIEYGLSSEKTKGVITIIEGSSSDMENIELVTGTNNVTGSYYTQASTTGHIVFYFTGTYYIDCPITADAGNYELTLYVREKESQDRKINIYVNEVLALESKISPTGNKQTYMPMGIVELTQGENIIRLLPGTSGGSEVYLYKLILKPVTAPSVKEIKFNEEALSGYVSCGSDVIKISMNNNISADNPPAVTVKDSDGKSYAHESEVSGNEISVYMTEAFCEDEKYTIDISGLYDTFGQYAESIPITFITDASAAETSCIELNEPNSEVIGRISINATVTSSAGYPLSGRNAKLSVIKKGETTPAKEITAVSDAEGKVLFDYAPPSNFENGEYTLVAATDFNLKGDSVEIIYMKETSQGQLLEKMKETTTAEDVFDVISEFSTIPIIPQTVFSKLDDGSQLFNKMIGLKADTVDLLLDKVLSFALILYINQENSAEALEEVLTNNEYIENLGIDKVSFGSLDVYKGDFLSELAAEGDFADEAAFKAVCDKLLNEYLAIEFNKTSHTNPISDKSAYIGSQVKYTMNFESTQADVVSIIYELTADKAIFDDITAASDYKELTYSPANNKIKFQINFDSVHSVKDYAEISFTANSSANGVTNITGSGRVIYKNTENGVLYSTEILSETVKLTVSEGSKGDGGGGSGSVTPSKNINVEKIYPTETNAPHPFKDISSVSWAEESITVLYKAGIINGVSATEFKPNDNVTREQFAKMLAEVINISYADTESKFSDVSENAWYKKYVIALCNEGIINGMDETTFGTGKFISRQDMAVMLVRAAEYLKKDFAGTAEYTFTDDSEISDYAKKAVYNLYAEGIINGTGENIFAPASASTRAMAAKMLYGFGKKCGVIK